MVRFLSRSLLRHATASATTSHFIKPNPYTAVSHRHRSSGDTKPQLIEMPLSDGDYDKSLKLFDDLIQRILVKKATPDWLPFVPGSSFWVPPRPTPSNIVDLVDKLTNELTDEQSLSLATLRGWPCSKFFIQESAHDKDADWEVNSPDGIKRTVKVKVLTTSENVANSEEEEG